MKKFLPLLLMIASAVNVRAADISAAGVVASPSKQSEALSQDELAGFRTRLLATTTQHLDLLLKPDGKVAGLKGKTADGMTAIAFYLVHEMTGDQKYRAAARELADRIVRDMKATKHGVLFIKEKDKDILGYFMLTTDALLNLRHFAPGLRQPALDLALDKACAFARSQIAPMTAPNRGPAATRTTRGTPAHYAPSSDPKRGFTLGMILIAGGNTREGMNIMDLWMKHFPQGDAGQTGAKSADSFAHMLLLLPPEIKKPAKS